MTFDIMLLAKSETRECYGVCDGRPNAWSWSSRASIWYRVAVFLEKALSMIMTVVLAENLLNKAT